ncbi:HAD-IIB family hydrolase [Candidatus Woesearchaeota archaeon]|nr:HAD-IIB family hydrolase [Candidatus Woesearchaeota archaeon]
MKSGGVKIVIENLMKAFSKFSFNSFTLLESGKQFNYIPIFDINYLKIPELNYNDKIFSSFSELSDFANSLSAKLESLLDFSKKCVIHVHNINLFKNSYLPLALKLLSLRHLDNLLVLYQVHDFAEDNRPDRLRLMQNCTGKFDSFLAGSLAFPLTKNSLYLTINSRDKRLLHKLGIPSERIFVFPNSVDIEFLSSESTNTNGLLDLISSFAIKNGFTFSKTRKNILYPVKVIRRKNILEAILLLNLINSISDEYQLLISLDANSPLDIEYSEKIKTFVKERNLPVVIGFGFEVISPNSERKVVDGKIIQYTLPDLFSISHSIITTSVLEGFGFAFVEGWITGKQVIGRRINLVMEDFENMGIKFPGFYDSILVDGIDFKNYSFEDQIEIVDTCDYSKLRREMESFVESFMNIDYSVIDYNRQIISKSLSLKGCYTSLNNIIEYGFSLADCEDYIVDNSVLINYFSKVDTKYVVLSDIDRTFIDDNYSSLDSKNAFDFLVSKSIPICFCTSKTFYEVRNLLENLDYNAPFIAENGSAIYVPKNYFSFDIRDFKFDNVKNVVEFENYVVLELNSSHEKTLDVLHKIQSEIGFPIRIYSEFSDSELSSITGLSSDSVKISKQKFYADGCYLEDFDSDGLQRFKDLALKYGFNSNVGGRFIGINNGCDKGIATKILMKLFIEEFKRVDFIGLGDSPNDFNFLDVVDFPYLVKRPDGTCSSDQYICSSLIGPKGWSEIIFNFFK